MSKKWISTWTFCYLLVEIFNNTISATTTTIGNIKRALLKIQNYESIIIAIITLFFITIQEQKIGCDSLHSKSTRSSLITRTEQIKWNRVNLRTGCQFN